MPPPAKSEASNGNNGAPKRINSEAKPKRRSHRSSKNTSVTPTPVPPDPSPSTHEIIAFFNASTASTPASPHAGKTKREAAANTSVPQLISLHEEAISAPGARVESTLEISKGDIAAADTAVTIEEIPHPAEETKGALEVTKDAEPLEAATTTTEPLEELEPSLVSDSTAPSTSESQPTSDITIDLTTPGSPQIVITEAPVSTLSIELNSEPTLEESTPVDVPIIPKAPDILQGYKSDPEIETKAKISATVDTNLPRAKSEAKIDRNIGINRPITPRTLSHTSFLDIIEKKEKDPKVRSQSVTEVLAKGSKKLLKFPFKRRKSAENKDQRAPSPSYEKMESIPETKPKVNVPIILGHNRSASKSSVPDNDPSQKVYHVIMDNDRDERTSSDDISPSQSRIEFKTESKSDSKESLVEDKSRELERPRGLQSILSTFLLIGI